MFKFPMFRIALMAAALLAWQAVPSAQAQTAQTPQQIQGLIASGQNQAALNALKPVLAAHPDSGIAWYLTAEADDAVGNLSAARASLAKAQQLAPGLPFADQSKVAALKAHLAQAAPTHAAAATSGFGAGHGVAIIIGLAVLFFGIRFFMRSRRAGMMGANYPNGYGAQGGFPPGAPPPGYPPYGPGYGPGYGGGMGGGMGSGIGGAVVGGLAAGAGFAAGERVIDGLMGGHQNNGFPGGGNNGYVDNGSGPYVDNNGIMPAPDRDDGLLGQPGWDNNDPGSFDSGDDSNNGGW